MGVIVVFKITSILKPQRLSIDNRAPGIIPAQCKKIGGLLLRDELFGIHGLEPEEIFRESSPKKMVVPNN